MSGLGRAKREAEVRALAGVPPKPGLLAAGVVGAQPALAGADTLTINFAYVPARLRKEYFDRYVQDPLRLLPGTMMPKFVNDQGLTGITAYYGGEARRQFEAIWHFMRTITASSKIVEEAGK